MNENNKHPVYSDDLIPSTSDIFKPEFKRDSRGSYFMQLPGYGKWKVSVEPGSKIISQGSENEEGGPATSVESLMTGTLHASTEISVGDNILLAGGDGCIYIGDSSSDVGTYMSLCGDGLKGYASKSLVFGFFLTKAGDFEVGDVLIGGADTDNYVLWDNSAGTLTVKGTITASSGYIGGWLIDTCLKSEHVISGSATSKIELCPGNPGHVQVAYSPTGVYSIPGDVDMVQITQGSTADSGGTPIPRVDVYRNGTKRAMLNSDGLYFFESDGTTIATSILSGATNEEILNNVQVNAGNIEGGITLNNAQTINSVTSHVIDMGNNAHSEDVQGLLDFQQYRLRTDQTLAYDVIDDATYFIQNLWTSKITAGAGAGSEGVIIDKNGIRGFDDSLQETFILNANTGDFFFGDQSSEGNSVAWETDGIGGGALVVRGEIRALKGYIGGDTSGWKIDSNVMQAYSGATKVIELSSVGPHIQCLKDSSNYVQMTPASSDPRFDVFVGGYRRARLNESGLTFYTTGGSVTNKIGLGTADGDATFGGGFVRLFDKGIRISHDGGACALNLQDEGSTYLRMYVDTSSRSYWGTIDLPNSDVLTIRDKTGPPGNKLIDFIGRTTQGNNYGVTDLLSPLGLLTKDDGSVPTGALNGWMFYNTTYNEVWAYINGGWKALAAGTGVGTVTSVATSGAITGGTITTSGTISHSTSSGYKHIPSSGSTYQVLRNSGSGTAAWSSNVYIGGLSTYMIYRDGSSPYDMFFLAPSGVDFAFKRGSSIDAKIDDNFWTQGNLLADGQLSVGGTIQNTIGDIIINNGNLQLKKNGAIIAIDDSGGTTRYLTVQYNSTLSKYILST